MYAGRILNHWCCRSVFTSSSKGKSNLAFNFIHTIQGRQKRAKFFKGCSTVSKPLPSANTSKAKFRAWCTASKEIHLYNNIMSSSKSDNDLDPRRLVWIDLEMTGLDAAKERIIEIACLVTEGDLTIVAKGPNIVIHQEDDILNNMNEWCIKHHGQSGLTDAVRNSQVSEEEAEAEVLNFISKYVPPGRCPVAGNSVGTDKIFIEKYMPRLANHLHYRIVDVSTIKELCRRWYPEDFKNAPAKKLTHRAMDDILESIEELKYYQSKVFKAIE